MVSLVLLLALKLSRIYLFLKGRLKKMRTHARCISKLTEILLQESKEIVITTGPLIKLSTVSVMVNNVLLMALLCQFIMSASIMLSLKLL